MKIQHMKRIGAPENVLYFDDDGNGPDYVGAYATLFPDLGENAPKARIGLYTEGHGGLYMTAANAREIARQLIAAADAAEQ